jgi:hypothetical protein
MCTGRPFLAKGQPTSIILAFSVPHQWGLVAGRTTWRVNNSSPEGVELSWRTLQRRQTNEQDPPSVVFQERGFLHAYVHFDFDPPTPGVRGAT